LVPAELIIEGSRADQSQRDRRNRGAKKRPGGADHELGAVHRELCDRQYQQKCSANEQAKRCRDEQSLAASRIDQAAGGRLHRDCDQAAEGERESDGARIPSAEREIRGEEWAESGLDIGEEEVEPPE
jgi:hypothetical protein